MNESWEARLLVQLFANGQLARIPGDTRSLQWWRITRLLEDEQQRQNMGHLADIEYFRNSLLRTIPNLTRDSKQDLDRVAAQLHDLREQAAGFRPKQERGQGLIMEAMDLRDRWKRAYGDPDDPAVQARIDATVKFLMRPARTARPLQRKAKKK